MCYSQQRKCHIPPIIPVKIDLISNFLETFVSCLHWENAMVDGVQMRTIL